MAAPVFDFERLRRFPDVEAENLFAVDASDRLLLDEAADSIASAPDRVAVIGDRYGALTLGAAALHNAFDIRVHQDPLSGELALGHNAALVGLDGTFVSHPLGEALLAGARTVLLQLPRNLAELDEIAAAIARHADPEVRVFAGGRIKHLTPAMNEVLGRHFSSVTASLARQKSRVLVARGVHEQAPDTVYPLREFNDELGLWVCAHGGAFSGTKLDIGTRYLLGFLREMKPDAVTAVDLGCGTGILACALAKSRPGLAVLASDQSAAAVASTRATAEANGLPVTVVRDVGLSSQPDDCADLILLNPPFHVGSAVHAGVALALFDEAARVLKPGGELWTVFNSHLRYRPALTRAVGPTRLAGQNPKFTVTVSTFEGRLDQDDDRRGSVR
ncbi:16S rRNA (guanine1207-N2)-methyltransferase [Homoserinimonas aerilata]|uniref:16S rRNA (Guanine1207-N2)-methyltransferase n=1 Tax=Homoserinimonas aerilata TaxID=1162970 RepID=A0A542YF68_9MICO|nr:class I SAM-dependent methyltransferase [Homoserinimonas aerilata]TQL46733.1 16S rRNA (guanine1207-N2)-methyltransferase [Homoserinimonas aerilata]